MWRLLTISSLLSVLFAAQLACAESWKDRLFTVWETGLVAPQKPHPAVVRVVVPEGDNTQSLGSGTLVDANGNHGLVVTNWHVVQAAKGPITVVFPSGFRSSGQVLKTDRDWDLAAILIERPPVSPVAVSNQPPQPGETLTIAGYGSGTYRAASGRCTQYVSPGVPHPYEIVELATSARQGDSGGPIFNARGELAGVLFGEGGGVTSGSYCRRVHAFLTSIHYPATSPVAPPLEAPVTSIAALAPRTTTPVEPTSAPVTPPARSVDPPPTAAEPPPAVVNDSPMMKTFVVSQPVNTPTPEAVLKWEQWLGTTRPEQVKSGLAVVGLLAMLLWTHRWVHGAPEPTPKRKANRKAAY